MNDTIKLPLLETEKLFLVPQPPDCVCRLAWAIVLKRTFDVNGLCAGGYAEASLGSVGLHLQRDKKELCAEAEYLFAEEHWGDGICAEALGKIMHYAFMGLKVDTIYINIEHRRLHQRPKRVVEKFGFTHVESKLYKLTRDEYYKMNNYPEALRSRDVYRIQYAEAANDYSGAITYQKQPNIYQCGQACVAMLAGVTPAEVAEIMFENTAQPMAI